MYGVSGGMELSLSYGENEGSNLYFGTNLESSNQDNNYQNNDPTIDNDSIDTQRLYNISPSTFNQENEQNSNNSLIANIPKIPGDPEKQEQSTAAQKMDIEEDIKKEELTEENIKNEEPKQDEQKKNMVIEEKDLNNKIFINENSIYFLFKKFNIFTLYLKIIFF